MAAGLALEPLPPREAIEFFRKKGYAIGFDWRDVWQEEHAVAFTVAKAMRVDILEDIRGAVDSALASGETFEAFRKRLQPTLESKGWWGRQMQADPLHPELGPRKVQLGSPRRLRIIYDTNLRMAHAAGRWEKIERLKKARPYLRYVAVMDERTRESHRQWHGTILPVDHPWWRTHYPPCGWRCRCIVQQLSESDLKRFGYKVSAAPPAGGFKEYRNKRTGEVTRVPDGIDPGFAYNVGLARMRAYTPPPAGGLPTSFPPAIGLPSLPTPATAPASKVMPSGKTAAEYAEAFLNEFGASVGKPVVFTDKAGEALVISERLFQDHQGAWKALKADRGIYMPLLAQALKEPDEIWWQWTQAPDAPWRLKRRFIKRWALPDGGETLIVFDWHPDGWQGVTAFPASHDTPERRARYIDRQRSGLLAYRKNESPGT